MKQKNDNFETVIENKNKLISFNIYEIFKYRDLIYLLIKRDFVVFYKQTVLGPLWYIIQPLVNTIVFTIIFGNLAQISTEGLPPFLFYMCGTIIWTYFASCVNLTANTFSQNSNLFGKVYFPRLVVPISAISINLLQFFIQFTVFICFYIYFILNGAEIDVSLKTLIIFPLLVLQTAILGLGFGTLISSMTTKYKDLIFVLTFGLQLWMFATPIVYPLSIIPDNYKILAVLNPMTGVVELFRWSFFGVTSIEFYHIIIGLVITFCCLFIGLIFFTRVEKNFIDTV